MAGKHRRRTNSNASSQRKQSAHGVKPRREPYRWLGAGAVTLGLGAALASGSGLAQATDTVGSTTNGTDARTSTNSSTGGSDSASGGSAGPEKPPTTRSETADNSSSLPGATTESATRPTDDSAMGDDAGVTGSKPSDTIDAPSPSGHSTEKVTTTDDEADGDGASSASTTPPLSSGTDPTTGDIVPSSATNTADDPSSHTTSTRHVSAVVNELSTEDNSDSLNIERDDPVVVDVQTVAVDVADARIEAAPQLTPEKIDDPQPAVTSFMSVTSSRELVDVGSETPATSADPLGDLLVAIFLGLQRTFFNQSPTANPKQDPDVVGGLITGDVGESDPDGDPVTVALAQGPSKGTVVVNPDGTYRYTPSEALAATGGTDSFTVTVTEANAASHIHGFDGLINGFLHFITGGAVPLNDGSTITKTVSVSVAADTATENHAPAASDPIFTVDSLDSTTGVVVGHLHVSDQDDDAVVFALAVPPKSALGSVYIDPTTGVVTFTPTLSALLAAQSFESSVKEAEFSVTASDGKLDTALAVSAPIMSLSKESLAALLARYGSTPSGVSVDTDGALYVTNSGANTLSIIDADGTKVDVLVGRAPQGVAVDEYGNVWVANSGDDTLTVVGQSGLVLHTVNVGDRPSAIAIQDEFVYVTNAADDTVSVVNTGTFAVERTIIVGRAPTGIAIGVDRLLYVANFNGGSVTVIDPDNNYAIDTLELEQFNPYGIAVCSDGTIAITDPTRNAVALLSLPSVALPTTLGPVVGSVVSVGKSTTYTMTMIATADNSTAITADVNGTLYVANTGTNTVTSINTRAGTVHSIQVGQNPTALFGGIDDVIYIAHGASDSVTKVDLSTMASTSVSVGVDVSTVTPSSINQEYIVINRFDGDVKIISAKSVADYVVSPWTTESSVAGGAIAVGPDGLIYRLTGGYFDSNVAAYDANGNFVKYVANFSNFIGGVRDLAIGQDGKVYAVLANARGNTSTWVYDPRDGSTSSLLPGSQINQILIADDGRLVVSAAGYVTYDENASYTHYNQLVIVDPDTLVAESVALFPDVPYWYSTKIALGPDGNVYAINTGASDLVIVDIDNLSTTRKSLNDFAIDVARAIAVGKDGRVYIGNAEEPLITVVKPDSTFDVLSTGVFALDLFAGGDGKIFVSATDFRANSVTPMMVVDSENYSMSVVHLFGAAGVPGFLVDFAGTPTASYVLAGNYGLAGGFDAPFTVNRLAPAVMNKAPSSFGDLWTRVRSEEVDANSGVYVQTIRGTDDRVRLIVYLGGTHPDANWWNIDLNDDLDQTIAENVKSYYDLPVKSDQKDLIDKAITTCKEDSTCGAVSEIMLVGYSQGGLDAQKIARDNSLGLLSENGVVLPITTVVTFGSPIEGTSAPGTSVIHIIDDFDELVGAVRGFQQATFDNSETLAKLSNEVYRGWSGTIPGFFAVHTNTNTYQKLSTSFWTTSGFSEQKKSISQFLAGALFD